MTRSSWKLPYISLLFFRNKFLKNNSNRDIRIRNSVIPSLFLEKKIKISVFNGIWYLSTLLNSNMLGCKFGEFSFTKRCDTQTHLKKKVQKKSKKKK